MTLDNHISPIWQNSQLLLFKFEDHWVMYSKEEQEIIGIWHGKEIIILLELIFYQLQQKKVTQIDSYIKTVFHNHLNTIKRIYIYPKQKSIQTSQKTIRLPPNYTKSPIYTLEIEEITAIHKEITEKDPKLAAESIIINGNIEAIVEKIKELENKKKYKNKAKEITNTKKLITKITKEIEKSKKYIDTQEKR